MTKKGSRYCHPLLRKTAQEMAASLYEDLATNPVWYAQAKKEGLSQDKFISLKWGVLLEDARATLAQLLATSLNERLKSEISDALILDHSLKRGTARLKPAFHI
jgi:hypothetical protein